MGLWHRKCECCILFDVGGFSARQIATFLLLVLQDGKATHFASTNELDMSLLRKVLLRHHAADPTSKAPTPDKETSSIPRAREAQRER